MKKIKTLMMIMAIFTLTTGICFEDDTVCPAEADSSRTAGKNLPDAPGDSTKQPAVDANAKSE
ncbi:hypothetical protein N9O57_02040 [bacterium]|nr:hypothetical protein [bacterium]